MAGYAMDLGDAGAQYAQGVTMPSATELGASAQAIEGIGRGLFSVMDSMVSSGKQKTQASIDREMYGSFAKRLQELKGQEGLTLRSSVNSLISEYSAQGFEIDANASKLIKMQTGIDVGYLNVKPQQEALNLASKKIAENPAYLILAEQTLNATGKPYTERDVLIEAIGQVQKNEAAALYLTNSKNVNRSEFYSSYLPQATMALDNVRNLALMGLDVELAGGNVSPDSIMQLRAKFDVVKSQFVKPPLIQDDDWQNVKSQIDTLDQLLVRLETYDEERLKKVKAGIVTPLTEAIAMQAKTMDDPLAAFSILSNLDKVSETWINSNLPKVIELTRTISPESVEFTPLPVFPELAEQVSQNVEEATLTPTEVLHTQESIAFAKKRSPKDRLDAIDFAYLNQVSLFTPDTMAEDFARENFVRGLEIISVNMVTSPNIMDDATIAKIFSEDTFNKLRKLKQYDNDAYLVTKERIANALRFQKTAQATAVYGSLKSSANRFLTVNDQGQVILDEEAIATAYPTGEKVLFKVKDLANTYYNNDLMEMYRDLGRKIPMEIRNTVIRKGSKLDFENINEAIREADRRISTITKYDELLRRLGAPVEVPTAGADYTEDNPYTFSGQTDEEQQVEFDQLPADSWFIDPDTGILAQK
jgi:1,2-phenylacetyl-CoA epoxidase PaaB subunit